MALSSTNLSSLNESISQVPVGDTIIPKDQLSLDEVFEKICGDMRQLSEDIKKQYRLKQGSAPPAPAAEKTVVMQEMSTLLENKTSIVNKLAASIKESKYNDFSHFKGEATISIPCMMKDETDSCQEAVILLEKLNEENLRELEILRECEKISKEMSETELEPEITESLLQKIYTEVTKEFKQCKKDMEKVIDTLYSNSTINVKEILGELVEKSAENGSSEWFEVKNTDMPFICLLSKWNLIKFNPDNDKLIQLDLY